MAGFYRSITWTCTEPPATTIGRCETLALRYEGAGPLHYQLPDWFDVDGYEAVDVTLEELGIELSVYDVGAWKEALATQTSMRNAFERWSPQRFVGLGLDFIIPCQPAGPRSIVGSLWWEIRRESSNRYLHHVAVQFPSRSFDSAELEEWLANVRRLLAAGSAWTA